MMITFEGDVRPFSERGIYVERKSFHAPKWNVLLTTNYEKIGMELEKPVDKVQRCQGVNRQYLIWES
jgi:hypothetical protein